MAKDMYVLRGERGEYEDRAEEIYGVFDTKEEAIAAIAEVPRLSAEGRARRQAFEERCKQLAALEGAPYVATDILNQTAEERDAQRRHWDKVREIKERLGPAPDFFCKSDRYWITKFKIGEISDGVVVFDTEQAVAA